MGDKPLAYLDFEILETPMLLKSGSIVLYGAAEKGLWVSTMLQAAGINVIAFADSDPNKCGTDLHDIPVLSPQDMRNALLAGAGKKYVISCIENTDECYQLLSELFSKDDMSSIGFISFWGIDLYFYTQQKHLMSLGPKMISLYEKQKAANYAWYKQVILEIFSKTAKKSNEILVFQPGKAGSSSVTKMLQASNISSIHVHRYSYPGHILGEEIAPVWKDAVKQIRHGPNKIISLIRDPLSKDYSAFWQSFSFPDVRYRYLPILSKDLQEMYDGYIDAILSGYGKERGYGISLPLTWREEFDWFDEEMKVYLGLDVYQYPFDREKGHTVIRQDNNELFLLKMEKIESALPALEAFLGEGVHLKLRKVNAASAKTYSMAYRAFRQRVRLKQEYVDHYFNGNAKVDHFYTKEEQAEFLKKWKDNIGS